MIRNKDTKTGNNLIVRNIILIVAAIVIITVPLIIMKDSEFLGTDGLAEEAVAEVNPGYEPWIEPLWEPPSGEIESLLFALQAAVGAGFIGYYIGNVHGKRKVLKENS